MVVSPHRECVDQALLRAGLTGVDRARAVNRILERIANGICPRCDAALSAVPARSRATSDRCVHVCGECGSHEGARAFAKPAEPEPIEDWPLDASEVRAQFQAARRRL
ncbi:hypothetical protein [Amycolatopsis sp. CA-230715]|uniref:hypothetical protein n=1 Tax=Amycolatopsis sp. CA-230715 TaxID=2745196 RepID=UPI001C025F3A|nr:hypothetical protein [Amycolatopsis sp. CA-230715]